MNENDLSATYSARHSHHLQTMTGAMFAQVIDLLARVDTAQAHAADLQAQLSAAEKQRDEALHMQAETFKTVEESGREIERLKSELAQTTEGRDAALQAVVDAGARRDTKRVTALR